MTVRFLTTLNASAKVEKIIKDAKKELILITPFLKLSNLFLERLKDADVRGVRIKLVYGKIELNSGEYDNLDQLDNLELYFCESLHAKCYLNEEQFVITSLNLYDYSIKNNREMGVYIKKNEDENLFNDALNEARSIMQSSSIEKISNEREIGTEKQVLSDKAGFCIRYHEKIPLNPEKPLCPSCYRVWTDFDDPDYPENYCHVCGEKANTSFRKPLCWNCYNKMK
ncbi:MAG: phospholipase D family protein [Candidatus Odinarchaeota archaeon]